MTTLDDVTCASTADQLCEKLESYGVARAPGFLTLRETELILAEAHLATSSHANYQNPYGPCCRFSLEQLPPRLSRSRDLIGGSHLEQLPAQFEHTRELMGSDFFRNITQTYLGAHCGFMEVIAFTRDCIPDPKGVYGKVHYDRRHQLKFIVYLNDVDESNGAFGCIAGSINLGRRLFHEDWSRILGLEAKGTSEIEQAAAAIPEDDSKYRLLPCVVENLCSVRGFVTGAEKLTIAGPAGTLVAFDTHLLHYGGFVRAAKKERWTLKGHTLASRN
jgi:hypothetical protein